MKIDLPTNYRICHCEASNLDSQTVAELEDGFQRLRLSEARTPLRAHLRKRLFRLLEFRRTPLGATLLDVAQVGLRCHDAAAGVVFPDALAYEVFQALYDPILEDRHWGFEPTDCQPPVDWGDWARVSGLDPNRKYIQACAVSASRNLKGHRFTPTMGRCELAAVEDRILYTLYKLPGEYRGRHEFIHCMPPSRRKKLEEDHCLFTCGDKYDHAANVPRFWSYGRGLFVNDAHTFVVWINAKDHMRVICQEKSGDLQKAYHRLADVMPVLDTCLQPARHERLGYLTVSPDDVGSGVSASVYIKLPQLPKDVREYIARVYHLETKCVDEEENLYLVWNRSHLGYTEYEVMKEFNHGIRELYYMARFYNDEREGAKTGDGEGETAEESEAVNAVSSKGEDGDEGGGEMAEHTTEVEITTTTTTVTTTTNEVVTPGGGDSEVVPHASAGGGLSEYPAPKQEVIWAVPSLTLMQTSVRNVPELLSYHRSRSILESRVQSAPSQSRHSAKEASVQQSLREARSHSARTYLYDSPTLRTHPSAWLLPRDAVEDEPHGKEQSEFAHRDMLSKASSNFIKEILSDFVTRSREEFAGTKGQRYEESSGRLAYRKDEPTEDSLHLLRFDHTQTCTSSQKSVDSQPHTSSQEQDITSHSNKFSIKRIKKNTGGTRPETAPRNRRDSETERKTSESSQQRRRSSKRPRNVSAFWKH